MRLERLGRYRPRVGNGVRSPGEEGDLEQAARIAGLFAGYSPLADSYQRLAMEEAAPALVKKATELVRDETGLSGDGDPTVAVIDRLMWVERNLAFFSALMSPAEDDGGGGSADSGVTDPSPNRLMAAEMGILLGFLSHRVLGQYELVLPSAGRGDEICLSAPNILEFERKHQLHPTEFRFWVALHEATHRLQFVSVPWLRPYFLDLAKALVSVSKVDEPRLATLVAGIRRARTQQSRDVSFFSLGEAGLPGLMATPVQLRYLDKVQALMSLLEGHGHVVMDRIGARRLVSWKRMSTLMTRRRNNPRVAALMRITGLDMKLRQYEEGRRFILDVERRAGWSAVDLAWESPDALPTRSEIKAPESWLARVG